MEVGELVVAKSPNELDRDKLPGSLKEREGGAILNEEHVGRTWIQTTQHTVSPLPLPRAAKPTLPKAKDGGGAGARDEASESKPIPTSRLRMK